MVYGQSTMDFNNNNTYNTMVYGLSTMDLKTNK